MSIEFGIYPLTGILVAGLLYGVYRLFIRMHCNPRIAQRYIVAVVMVSLVVSFIQPVQYEEQKSFFEQQSSGGSHSESKEPLIVVDGTVMGNAPETPHGKSNDDDQQLSTLLGINEDDISSVTVLQGSASAAIYGLEGKNGVIEVTTKKSSQPIGILTPKATKMMRYIYLIGLCAMLIYILIQMLWLIRVRRRSTHMAMEGGVRVYDSDIPTPFSFGNSVFIPNEIEGHLREDILVHEREHLRHRHYMKLCMMQLLQSFGWFNPFIWLFSSEQKLQQEMEVDCAVINTGRNREQYQMNLLRICLHGNKWVQIMPAFGSSIIKQRILFMNRWKPTRHASFRLVAALLAAGASLPLLIKAPDFWRYRLRLPQDRQRAKSVRWLLDDGLDPRFKFFDRECAKSGRQHVLWQRHDVQFQLVRSLQRCEHALQLLRRTAILPQRQNL